MIFKIITYRSSCKSGTYMHEFTEKKLNFWFVIRITNRLNSNACGLATVIFYMSTNIVALQTVLNIIGMHFY